MDADAPVAAFTDSAREAMAFLAAPVVSLVLDRSVEGLAMKGHEVDALKRQHLKRLQQVAAELRVGVGETPALAVHRAALRAGSVGGTVEDLLAPWAEEEASGDAVQTWAAAAEAPMAAGVETSASPESCPEEARLLSNALAALSKSDAKRAEATSSSTGPGPGPGAGPGLNGGPGPLFGDHDHAPLPSTVVTKPVAEARALLAQINQLPEVLGSEAFLMMFHGVCWPF